MLGPRQNRISGAYLTPKPVDQEPDSPLVIEEEKVEVAKNTWRLNCINYTLYEYVGVVRNKEVGW